MRLWSLHPEHLDRAGLLACWREALLAQAVLAGRTRGYVRHPQLERFRAADDPLAAVGAYLAGVADEARRRGYRFDAAKIERPSTGVPPLTVTSGQVEYEWQRLTEKLSLRSPHDAARLREERPRTHPLFTVVEGPIERWERVSPAAARQPSADDGAGDDTGGVDEP
ncbi:pyrimidine dimer DNA glycosylase/endonuclease V [Ruicaihuangia caeni]|uniref:Pyrimidine dimer DNA glycosylase/endonuclease V n=1 Tax=Ruicaihuangia caeni TaxID=3042517 RepID=A0AAW6T3A3_9MICO|nr:pyrimidine dimer DNA glycosylase/endonuclease V [Klugiella sp. YN-L-19]MDI2098300.1 pyrimidine dimer DNA glycosylase/endonuclease V [Klugiella sp. YN-L-19]